MYTNGISSSSSTNAMYKLLQQISAGKKINSAADDASGLAVAKKLEALQTGLNKTNNNISDSQGFLNTAEGGLSTTADSLQRIKELATQASNGTYSASDREIIQSEIDQLKGQIDNTSRSTQFNGQGTLNGSQTSLSGTSSPTSFDSSTAALGINQFDVRNGVDMKTIDSAISNVSTQRGEAGAKFNGMTHTMNANSIAEENILSARSRIEDADIAKMVMDFKNSQTVNKVSSFAQRMTQSTSTTNAGRYIDMLA